MGKKKPYAYCTICEKEISKPKRKSMDSMYYTVWILIIIASIGFAIIPLLIYQFIMKKKIFCPNCDSKLVFYSTPEESPAPKTQIEQILKTIENESKENEEGEQGEELMFCPFCQKEITKHAEFCPNCGVNLTEEK
ncbi:MAG: LITAF-like zinc ribbon domain-containing protein [Candidatus Hodarchaeota archaeon]